MLEGVHYLAIEGPIGVGKTSLAKALARRFGARLVLEQAAHNPFLESFYADMRRYALATQLVFLVSRYQQQAELGRRYLFDKMVISDYILAKDRLFAGLTLSEHELTLYNQLYEVMAGYAAKPDVLVLLTASVDVLMARIRARGVPCEAALTRDYLARLVAEYEAFFRAYDAAPLLVVDTNALDYAKGGPDLDALIAELDQTRTGRRLYAPGPERAS